MGRKRHRRGTPRRYRKPSSPLDRLESRRLVLLERMLSHADEMMKLDDPLAAEVRASALVSLWEGAGRNDWEADCLFGLGLVGTAEREATPAALGLLRGLAAVATPPVSDEARRAAGLLRRSGVEAPAWAHHVGGARFVEAWRTQDPLGDGDLYALVCEHPGRPRHTIAAYIDHNLGSAVKDVTVTPPGEDLRARWDSARVEDVTTIVIEPQEAADVLAHGLDVEAAHLDPPSPENGRRMIPLLRSRLSLLPPPHPLMRPEMSRPRREGLAEEFAASPEAQHLDPGAVDDVAWRIVDFCCDYGCGDPLRWSPIVVELFLADWLPRKAILHTPAEAVPDVLRGWIRFAGARKGLAPHLVRETVEAVEEWTPAFFEGMADPERAGPAKAILSAMRAEGVDLTDQAAADAWVADFNARPEQERRKVLP